LATLSARLGANTGYLSKALNDGLGMNFSTFVNGLRAEHVAERLKARDHRDLLEIAFEAGFASKASFNRAFKARLGLSPSAFRRQVSDHENPPPTPESEARAAQPSSISAA
jgi:AraC-like DNA-binding protein